MPLEFSDLGFKTQQAKRYSTICPKCDSDRQHHKGARCVTINDEPGHRWWNCHHCGYSGNLDTEDKYDKISEKAKMPKQGRAFTVSARNYIKKRGISERTLKYFQIYETTVMGKTQMNFPFFMHHTLVNVKHLNTEYKKGDNFPKWHQLPLKKEEGERKILPFGIHKLKTHDDEGQKIPNLTVLIAEGEWDHLTWFECEYKNVISVPQGAPSLKAKDFKKEFAWLADTYVKSILEHVDYFYLAADNDEAGKLLNKQLSMILGKEKCRIIQYPTGYKDINEVLVGNEKKELKPLGKEGVEGCYKNISSIPINGIIKVASVYDNLMKLREDGFTPGYGCGVKEVDHLFTLKRKLVAFVTGIPGSGKSVWIRWWLTKFIIHNVDLDFKWAMFTPENRPVEREYAKIIEVFTGQTFQKGSYHSMSDETMKKAMRWCQKHIFIISPDKYNYEKFDEETIIGHNSLDSILKYVAYLKKTENIFGFVIDAWNKLEHEQPKNQTETNFISQQLDKVISFSDYWDVAAIIIAHPKKIEMTGENFKMPSLYDIKGSSAWKEKADIGVLIHRYKMKKMSAAEAMEEGVNLDICDEDEKWKVMPKAPTIIRTEKIKFEETGNESRVKMEMKNFGQFFVLNNDDKALSPPKETKVSKKNNKVVQHPDSRTESINLFDKDDDDESDDLPF